MRLRRLPTVATLAVIGAVFLLKGILDLAGWTRLFVLAPPVTVRPWTAVTSVYAHATPGHLLGNALALALFGPLVARRTTPLAFHAYFVGTGALAGVAEVVLGGLIGAPTAVLGASSAILALLGYVLTGNVVSTALLDRVALSRRAQLGLFLAVAVVFTVVTAGTRTALFGHATGLVCGLVAGRVHLLD